jgi:hypothetical protein
MENATGHNWRIEYEPKVVDTANGLSSNWIDDDIAVTIILPIKNGFEWRIETTTKQMKLATRS